MHSSKSTQWWFADFIHFSHIHLSIRQKHFLSPYLSFSSILHYISKGVDWRTHICLLNVSLALCIKRMLLPWNNYINLHSNIFFHVQNNSFLSNWGFITVWFLKFVAFVLLALLILIRCFHSSDSMFSLFLIRIFLATIKRKLFYGWMKKYFLEVCLWFKVD